MASRYFLSRKLFSQNPAPFMNNRILCMALALASLAIGRAQTVPALVNYQGKLTNAQGDPLPTGDYTLSFSVYDGADGAATKVWGPQIFDGRRAQGHGPLIPVVQGFFNVLLGPSDNSGASLAQAFSAPSRYVEISVNSAPPILPRLQIVSAPFALRAESANTAAASQTSLKLNGFDWTDMLGILNPASGIPGTRLQIGSLPADRLVLGSITAAQIAPNTITGAQLANQTIGREQLKSMVAQNPASIGNVAISPLVILPGVSYTTNGLMTVSLQTSGRPVFIGITGGTPVNLIALQGGENLGLVKFTLRSGVANVLSIFLLKTKAQPGGSTTLELAIPSSSISYLDFPPAGLNTYSLDVSEIYNLNGNNNYSIYGRLYAFEL